MEHTALQQLRSLLEGKTIAKIEEPGVSEAIAKFVMTDGSAFRLHATELGFWIEGTIASPDSDYPSLTALAVDYCHHAYSSNRDYDDTPATIVLENDRVAFFAPDDTAYSVKLTSLTATELNILHHQSSCKVLLDSLILGEAWTTLFLKRNATKDIPDNCIITPKHT